MSLFKDKNGLFSTKKTMNVIIFLMLVITWTLGFFLSIPEWMPNFVLGACATSFAQYTYGKRIDEKNNGGK